MACFGHINQSGPQGVYQGRFGAYEVSVKNNPSHMKTEVMMCYHGVCVGNMFDEYELSKMHHGRGESIREIVFEEVARLLDRKLENDRHDSMVSMAKAPDSATAMYAPHRPAAVQHQIEEADRLQNEMYRRMVDSMTVPAHLMGAVRAPPVNININTAHTPKKKKTGWKERPKIAGTLREQLQAETDEWLKEVRAA